MLKHGGNNSEILNDNSSNHNHQHHHLKTPKNYGNIKDLKTPKTVGRTLVLRDITNSASLKFPHKLAIKEQYNRPAIDSIKPTKRVEFDTIIDDDKFANSSLDINASIPHVSNSNYLDIDNLSDDQIPDIEYAPVHLDLCHEENDKENEENDHYDFANLLRPKEGIILNCHKTEMDENKDSFLFDLDLNEG